MSNLIEIYQALGWWNSSFFFLFLFLGFFIGSLPQSSYKYFDSKTAEYNSQAELLNEGEMVMKYSYVIDYLVHTGNVSVYG